MNKEFLKGGGTLSKKQIIRLILLNLGIVLLNVILFSKGLIGLTLGGSILATAFGITAIIMSVIAFFWGNISLLFKKPTPTLYIGTELTNEKDYTQALAEKRDKKVFIKDINTVTEQISRIRSRNESLDTILRQHFSPQEITSVRFHTIIDSVNDLFYGNVKKMLNRITIFDDRDYNVIMYKLKYSTVRLSEEDADILRERLAVYQEHLDYIKNLIEMNEGIIVKLDRLLLELAKLDDFDETNIEKTPAIQEMNDLIQQTKLYKQP